MAAPKTPQDRKPKQGSEPVFTFTHDGRKHKLPPSSQFAGKVPGGITTDAILEPDNEMAQLRLGLAMLNAVEGHDESRAALRAMPSEAMFEVLGAWMEFGDGDGASVPQS